MEYTVKNEAFLDAVHKAFGVDEVWNSYFSTLGRSLRCVPNDAERRRLLKRWLRGVVVDAANPASAEKITDLIAKKLRRHVHSFPMTKAARAVERRRRHQWREIVSGWTVPIPSPTPPLPAATSLGDDKAESSGEREGTDVGHGEH